MSENTPQDDGEQGGLWPGGQSSNPAKARKGSGPDDLLSRLLKKPPQANEPGEDEIPREIHPGPGRVESPAHLTDPASGDTQKPQQTHPGSTLLSELTEQTHPRGDTRPCSDGTDPPIIRLDDLHVSFGSLRVLNGVSLNLHRGQITVIIGPSGVGKSVLLKNIAGLIKPNTGKIFFEGNRIDHLGDRQLVAVRKQIGFLFQMGALFDSMTVGENICFPLEEHGLYDAQERQRLCSEVLGMVGLAGIEAKMPADLSGGQRKRVALARAVMLRPKVMLYDEPTTGLDPIRSDVINELILNLAHRLCMTSVVVTHDMTSANKIADRMVMVYEGRIIADDEPVAFHNTDNDVVQRFIRGQADQDQLAMIRAGFADADLPPSTENPL